MGILRYWYLRWGRILPLLLVVASASMLASSTATLLLGAYRGVEAFAASSNVIVVYDASSRTPFTGLLSLSLVENISAARGVEAVSPEVIAPCLINGKPVFVRGVEWRSFTRLTGLKIVSGEPGLPGNSVLIGFRAAERLGLKPGDTVLVASAIRPVYLALKVRGIYVSESPLDDELIVGLREGQWLRGAGQNAVTIIRVKASEGLSLPEAGGIVHGGRPSLGDLASRLARYLEHMGSLHGGSAASPGGFAEKYLEPYGFSREVLLTLSVIVILFSSAGIAVAAGALVLLHRLEIGVLESIGASPNTVRIDIVLKLAPLVVGASLIGVGLGALLMRLGGNMILAHMMPWSPGAAAALLVVAATSILALLTLAAQHPGGGKG